MLGRFHAKEVNPGLIHIMVDSLYHSLLCDMEKLEVLTFFEALLEARLCWGHRYTV